jgi:flagellar hook-associated protein 2
MSPINISTVSTQLTTYLNQSIAQLQTPITTLKNDKTALQTKTAVFTDLKTKLEALKTAAAALSGTGSLSAFGLKSTVSSNTGVVTCEATSAAVSCAHTVFVTQLAKAHAVVSDRYDQDATSLSAANAGTKSFSISVGENTYQVSVTIAAGDSNETVLSKIAAAINDATDGKVAASMVVDTPTTAKLSVRSVSSGTVGKMTFVDTGGLLGAMGVTNQSQATNTAGGYVYADLGNNELDAMATVDGVQIISSDNTLDQVVEGLTINLLSAQKDGDSPVGLTVSIDLEAIKAKVKSFLTAYNEAFSYLVTKTKVDATTYTRAVLSGEYSYVSLRLNMRAIMSSNVGTASEAYRALSQIGITSDRAGSFSVSDEALLSDAISSGLDSMQSLFASGGGVASGLSALLDGYVEPTGTITTSKEGISTRMEFINRSIEREQKFATLRERQLREEFGRLQEALYSLQASQQLADSFSAIVGV